MTNVFKSKINAWVVVRRIVTFVVLITIFFATQLFKPDLTTILLMVFLAFLGIITPLLTKYKLTDDGIFIVSLGLRKVKIAVDTIKSIKTNNTRFNKVFLPASVNSYEMLTITYNESSDIIISPKDKNGLIKALQFFNRVIIIQ